MAEEGSVKISVVTSSSPVVIKCSKGLKAEDLCVRLCKEHKIPPLTRSLFALKVKGKQYFLKDNCEVLSSTRDYELRIRFKVLRLGVLITLDKRTYDYYFKQVQQDVFENKIPEIKYPEHKKQLFGLGIADMSRAIVEEKLVMKDVINNYKKYIPKVIVKKHGPFLKKYAQDYLPKVCSMGHDITYLKNLYLQHVYSLAPNYLSEEYDNVIWENGEDMVPVKLVIVPFHPHEPGIRLYNTIKRDWLHVCAIEELIYLTRNGNNSLEVSRKGTPLFLKFTSEEQLASFISLCDGYYRLMVKWTFNLSKDDETPSLKELQRIKCHGPVGGAFSYRKLEEKRGKKHGSYILRKCQYDYDVYFLDVCTKNHATETYKIVYKGHGYILNGVEYPSIERIIAEHSNPEGNIFLNECIPPSEYDKSQLLLCGEPERKGIRIDQAELQEILRDNKSPRCLPNKDILLYTGSEKLGSENITATYKALWRLGETKKLLVAYKTLQKDKANEYLKDFIELASKWSCIQSSSIVRLYGVTLSSPTALVLEYLPYGPFDIYLRENSHKIQQIHLKKVAAGLARALWDLSEAGVVHGFIRCRRLLLSVHDADRIVVKLSGPALCRYKPDDVHWMPVDFFADMEMARRSVVGDIWAFATTLWEVFSYGQSPTHTNPVMTARSYKMGERLLKPAYCPNEVWEIMRQCWQCDPLRPQEIMRDMNHMLHKDYVPRNVYEEPYASAADAGPRYFPIDVSANDTSSNKSLISSDQSSVISVNGTSTEYTCDVNSSSFDGSSNSLENMNPLGLLRDQTLSHSSNGLDSRSLPYRDEFASNAPVLMQSIVCGNRTHLVTLDKKIGGGTYGEVYKGWMESDNQEFEKRVVAVKNLNQQASEGLSLYTESKNELDIMKSLYHENIVKILGYWWKGPELMIVMEYMEQGSLYFYLMYQGDMLTLTHLLSYAKDIASGMEYISCKNIVHRDLAARNILVVDEHRVKISDFGLARIIPREENEYRVKTDRLLPIKWYAPESAVEPFHFSTKSDVWSYGVTAWEIFTRARQEIEKFDVYNPTLRASCFPKPEDCPSEIFRHLMKNCWDLQPERRPSFIELVRTCERLLDEYK